MGIFDIFKKNKTDSTFPENELEQCLIHAATETSAQKEFYQKLLWNKLYVLTAGHNASEEGTQLLEKNTTVQFVTFEGGRFLFSHLQIEFLIKELSKKKFLT